MSGDPQVAQPNLRSPILVNTSATFAEMIEQLRGQSAIALDTESNSLYRYYPQVCLIQVTTFASRTQPDPYNVIDYLVDPLALPQLQALGELFVDPALTVIMHAADNDILLLQRDFAFQFHSIFDTQLAARILGWKAIGLAAMLRSHFGIVSDKRMQLTNWGQRPLTSEQIRYAQMDTHFLPLLRTKLIQALKAAGRWEEAQEAFSMLRLINYAEREPSQRTFWQMRRSRDVPRKAMGVLEALWTWREEEAQRSDRPPFKVLTDQTLAALAINQPTHVKELNSISGLGQKQIKRYGRVILAVIRDGQTRPLPDAPGSDSRGSLAKTIQHRYDALRQWRTAMATKRGVAPEIVFSNHTLLTIAKQIPQSESDLLEIPEIGPWKAKTYGSGILRTLQGHNDPA